MRYHRVLMVNRFAELPPWYKRIRQACKNHGLSFVPWYDEHRPWLIERYKAWIESKKVRLSVTQKRHRPSKKYSSEYSGVNILLDAWEYDCLLVLQLLERATFYIIPADRLQNRVAISLPIREETNSQWRDCQENWRYFHAANR